MTMQFCIPSNQSVVQPVHNSDDNIPTVAKSSKFIIRQCSIHMLDQSEALVNSGQLMTEIGQ